MPHLRQLCEALWKAKLELNRGKCAFGAQEVKYSGHLVTRDGVRACPSKVTAIVEMPRPACAKEVQGFVGKCQYYRKFSPLMLTLSRLVSLPRFAVSPQGTWPPLIGAASNSLARFPSMPCN